MSKTKQDPGAIPVKVGRLKKQEENYIISQSGKMTPAEIGKQLNRSERQVLSVLSQVPAKPRFADKPETSSLRAGLKESAFWASLKAELEPDELVFFEEQYIGLMEQFKSDSVLFTEENQVFKVIKIDILKHRNAVRQKKCLKELERCERLHEKWIKSPEYEKLESKALSAVELLDQKMSNLSANQSGLANEYVRLEGTHQKLMGALKATREQRVDKIESGNTDFLGLLRSLGDENVLNEHDRYIELMRRASNSELKRLSQAHKFGDGAFDQPLLSESTVNTETIE